VEAETLNLGPLKVSLGLEVGVEYDDNINNSEQDPRSDVAFFYGPTIGMAMELPLRVGVGREEPFVARTSFGFRQKQYSRGAGQEDMFNAPVSLILMQSLHLGEWVVTVSDNFAFNNDVLESAAAAGARTLNQYTNTGSVSGTRRFGRFVLTLSGQRMDRWVPQSISLEETTYSFSVIPAVFLKDNMSVFWSTSTGFVFPVDYSSRSDGVNMTTMFGISGQITPALSGSVGVGYVHSEFDVIHSPTGDTPGGGIDSMSGQMNVNYAHPLRPNTTHTFSVYYSPGVTATLNNSNYQTSYGARYMIIHFLNRRITLSPTVSWSHTQDEGGTSGQKVDMLGFQVGVSYLFTRHLSGAISYRLQNRISNLPNGSYDKNLISTSLSYTF
jgi:hypothetical protein